MKQPALLTTTSDDSSSGTNVHTSRSVLVAATVDTLDLIGSRNGDFHTPNPHNYRHTVQTVTTKYHTARKVIDGTRSIRTVESGATYPQGSFPSPMDSNNVYNTALGRLGEAIRGTTDLSIDGFQIGQSVKLVKQLLSVRKVVEYIASKTWRDTSVALRRRSAVVRNYRSTALERKRQREFAYHKTLYENPMKQVGSVWLAFQYGIRPTMQTIYDVVKQNHVRAGNSMQIKSSSGSPGVYAKQVERRNTNAEINSYSRVVTVFENSIRIKFGGSYLPSGSQLEAASRLTSLNPVSIAWELLPFSFVVDWFYDVGGYLRATETAMISNLGSFSGYQTGTTRMSYSEMILYSGKDPQGFDHVGSVAFSNVRTTFGRLVLTSVPYPRKPRFKADLGAGRLLNAAALLAQLLKRK